MCAGRPRIDHESLYNNPSYILLEAIRTELENLHLTQFTDEMLSIFLRRDKNYVTKKYYKIRGGKLGYITQDTFNKIKEIVIDYFCCETGEINYNLSKMLDDYEIYLSNHKYIRSKARSKLYHPNLKADFFKNILTDEQIYWLGVMYSDGFVNKEKDEYREYYRIGLKVKISDEEFIDRYIFTLGLNPERKHKYEELQEIDGKLRLVSYYRIYFANQQMAEDLISNGVLTNKSKKLRLPEFESKRDYLPFLLGCFDGDGEAGSSRLWSGSRNFLEDIKELFNVPNEIQYRESRLGSAWGLSLGPRLFNAMIDSYEDSMPRKRKKLMER